MRARIEEVEHVVHIWVELEAGVPAAAGEGRPRCAHVHNQLRVVGEEFIGTDAGQGSVFLVDMVVVLCSFPAEADAELPEV